MRLPLELWQLVAEALPLKSLFRLRLLLQVRFDEHRLTDSDSMLFWQFCKRAVRADSACFVQLLPAEDEWVSALFEYAFITGKLRVLDRIRLQATWAELVDWINSCLRMFYLHRNPGMYFALVKAVRDWGLTTSDISTDTLDMVLKQDTTAYLGRLTLLFSSFNLHPQHAATGAVGAGAGEAAALVAVSLPPAAGW
jgi:hypothetical protein